MSDSSPTSPFETLRGRLEAALLAELPAAIDRLGWDAERLEQHRRVQLRRLLRQAIRHSPFHRSRLGDLDVERFEPGDLASLPVMTKSAMVEHLDDVYTDRRLTSAGVERALAATAADPVPILGDYVALGTGGSSGRRTTVVVDTDASVAFVTSLTRALTARVLAQGGAPPGGLPIAFVAAPSAVHATGSAPAWTAGGRLPFRFVGVPATLPLPRLVECLNRLDAPGLAGYPTALARLAQEREAGRLRIAPRLVTSTAETLTPALRQAIRHGLDAPVVDTYGSTEGLVGVSAPDDDVVVFNSDVCIVEVVDEHDRPVPPGAPSAKVLVTNLANRVQPLIRYEVHDRFVRLPGDERGWLRARVEGRCDEVLRYPGVDVHPLALRHVFVTTPEVLDYQVRQTPGGVDVDALARHPLDLSALRDRLTGALEQAGLAEPEVAVRLVESLDRHPETGKLRRFVPRP